MSYIRNLQYITQSYEKTMLILKSRKLKHKTDDVTSPKSHSWKMEWPGLKEEGKRLS